MGRWRRGGGIGWDQRSIDPLNLVRSCRLLVAVRVYFRNAGGFELNLCVVRTAVRLSEVTETEVAGAKGIDGGTNREHCSQ